MRMTGSAVLFHSVIVPFVSADGDAVVSGQPLLKAGGQKLLALPQQELLQIYLASEALLFVCEMDVWNNSPPPSLLLY